ncbi:MAG TPA: putative molybdenum carrier protein [Stellaceae bacterium]|nr:putative molybdenum carrier protein [Stellaceae bacterium]
MPRPRKRKSDSHRRGVRPAKIISGGQSGADLGSLRAGEALRIATGGMMPKGFRTEDGPRPDYACRFGMRETSSTSYRSRTKQNVIESDGTVIFSGPLLAGGSLLTKRLCDDLGKPCLVLGFPTSNDQSKLFVDWLASHQVRVLNIAGNRESNSPGIEGFVFDFLVGALKEP